MTATAVGSDLCPDTQEPCVPPPWQVLDAAAVDALAVATSHPTWMVARWAPRFGPAATLALLQANNRCAWVSSGLVAAVQREVTGHALLSLLRQAVGWRGAQHLGRFPPRQLVLSRTEVVTSPCLREAA